MLINLFSKKKDKKEKRSQSKPLKHAERRPERITSPDVISDKGVVDRYYDYASINRENDESKQ